MYDESVTETLIYRQTHEEIDDQTLEELLSCIQQIKIRTKIRKLEQRVKDHIDNRRTVYCHKLFIDNLTYFYS